MIEELLAKFKEKNDYISQCEVLQNNTVSHMEKIDHIITKDIIHIDEMAKKLDTVNPSNGNDKYSNDNFKDNLNNKNDEITRTREELDGFKNQLT